MRSTAARAGYVLKGVGSKTLAEILETVAAGESYLSPVLSARLLSTLRSLTQPSAQAGSVCRRSPVVNTKPWNTWPQA